MSWWEFVEGFTGKQKRKPGKHSGKTPSDVNMATRQPVCSALALSLVPESDVTLFFPFSSELAGKKQLTVKVSLKLSRAAKRDKTLDNSHKNLSRFKFDESSRESMKVAESGWEFLAKREREFQLISTLALVWPRLKDHKRGDVQSLRFCSSTMPMSSYFVVVTCAIQLPYIFGKNVMQ